MMQDLFGISMALGTVSNIEQRLSTALAEPVDAVAAFIHDQRVVHADETGGTQDKHKAWMWVVACANVAVFCVDSSRGSDVVKRLIDESLDVILVSDRWGGYAWLNPKQRQLCWSHLLRDFQSWIDDGNGGAVYGQHLTTRISRIFALSRAMKCSSISPEIFRQKMRKHQMMVATYLDEASRCGDLTHYGHGQTHPQLEQALWSFVDREGVDPANNYAECLIRPAVIWRKVSFGTDCAKGSCFVERMLTAVTTLRLQSKNVLAYLRDVLVTPTDGARAPSLLPA